jgi:zinc D-Ala-D-Ala carboxypeptidase
MVESGIMQRFALPFIILLIIIIAVLSGILVHQNRTLTALHSAYATTLNELEATRGNLSEKEAGLSEKVMTLEETRVALALAEENAAELSTLLEEEKNRNEDFEDQIRKVSGTVGKLDKLSKIDPELLMKYSKVYFLNEHYTPAKVVEIASSSRLKANETEYIDAKVAPYLEDMLDDARDDGITLKVVSAYRSFAEQKSLKSTYTTIYGSGANAFSADQGYSEHQLGTTLDFTSDEIGGGLTGFETTEAYVWLLDHAHRYGFVLSYPKNNAYYVFEPWHWRFVGEDLADDLHDDGKFFYDLDQREIDTYLIKLFD